MPSARSYDDGFMELAIKISYRGLGLCAPNPNVGAVIVKHEDENIIVGRGWTQPSGRPHAETVALDMAGKEAKGATAYVTLEPCSHFGKTPPCVDSLIESGISRVVYGIEDPDPRVCGSGIKKLRENGVVVHQTSPELQLKALSAMRGFIYRHTKSRPFVQVKMAIDRDGFVPNGNGEPVWVTGLQARLQGHLYRAQSDAILIGRGTAMADNPSLSCRLPGMFHRSPIRVVLDSKLRVSRDLTIISNTNSVPTWIFSDKDAIDSFLGAFEGNAVELIGCDEDITTGYLSLDCLLAKLSERGITRLMVEGGPNVYSSFFKSDYVDEIVVFQSKTNITSAKQPALQGANIIETLNSDRFHKREERYVGEDIMKRYERRHC